MLAPRISGRPSSGRRLLRYYLIAFTISRALYCRAFRGEDDVDAMSMHYTRRRFHALTDDFPLRDDGHGDA